MICNVDADVSKDVGTRQAMLHTSRGAFTHWIGSLSPGFYIVIPFSTSFWNEENIPMDDYTLVIHSKVQINVQVTLESPTLLADCLIATVLKNHNYPHRVRCIGRNFQGMFFSLVLFRRKIIIIM